MTNENSSPSLKNLQAQTDDLKKNANDLNEIFTKLEKSEQDLGQGIQATAKILKDYTEQIKANTVALQALTDLSGQHTQTLNLAKGSLQQNKVMLADLLNQYNLLSATQGDNSKQVKALNGEIGHLSATIDEQEKKLSKRREVFDQQKESIDALKSSSEAFKKSNKEFGPLLEDATKGFNAMKTGLSAVKTGFQSVGGALKTTGFGLLIIALQALEEYFTKNTQGIKVFKGVLASIGLVIETVKKVIANFSEAIIDAVIHPADTFKKIWSTVIENITNRFTGIKVFFEGLFSGNIKKMGDGVIQMATGVTNATDKISKAITNTKKSIITAAEEIKKTYNTAANASGKATATAVTNHKTIQGINKQQSEAEKEKQQHLAELVEATSNAADDQLNTIARLAAARLRGYAKEVADANTHYGQLIKKYDDFLTAYQNADQAFQQKYLKQKEASISAKKALEQESAEALNLIQTTFQQQDLQKLEEYEGQLIKISKDSGEKAQALAIKQLTEEEKQKLDIIAQALKDSKSRRTGFEIELLVANDQKQIDDLNNKLAIEKKIQQEANDVKVQLEQQLNADIAKIKKDAANKKIQDDEDELEKPHRESLKKAQSDGHNSTALKEQKILLEMQYTAAMAAAKKEGNNTTAIVEEYAKKKAAAEDQLATSRIHAGDKFINAALQNSKKDSAIYKAAFLAKKATSIADTIISTKRAVLDSLKAYSSIPFIGQALGIAQAAFMAGQGALSIAEIAKQKPGFARGGQYVSDGRGTVLPGYSSNDNTNAYLRSGEAVVVSEAMRNPWARNLVSAINVAHGGRDFSTPNPGKGYAIGGIFTDGGNSNRYYSQPLNDVKDLANTLAYQMINNFPPIYVDVKDVNTQQNILAQTINRVNL